MQSLEELLTLWGLRCARCSDAFYAAATRYKRIDTALTILNVVASISVLSLSIGWSTYSKMLLTNPGDGKLPIAVASIVVVISSVLQYVLGCGALSIRYKEVGVEYASLRRKIEILTAIPPQMSELEALRVKYHEIATIAPLVPRGIWSKYARSHPEVGRLERQVQAEAEAQTGPKAEAAAA
ncbi:MAG TPA: hypothetical protein VGG48_10815 [Rhizomicrobium sp.]